jgi:hypothetical protein
VKVFIILLLIACLIWILWTFNVGLPKIRINLKEDERPAERSRQQTAEIAKKISKINHADDNEEDDRRHAEPQTISKSFISTIIKKQAQEKIAEKEKKTKVSISFSGDKPTFMTNILESN